MNKGISNIALSASTTLSTCLSTASKNRILSMPLLGLGTFEMNGETTIRSAIRNALDLGYRRIDCAPVYFNEHLIGDALFDYLHMPSSKSNDKLDEQLSSLKREDLFITSKLASPFHRKEHVEPALRKTLSDLRTDYLDLYLIHWPVSFYPVEEELDISVRGYKTEKIDDSNDGKNIDPSVSIHETWEAMEALVEKGLVRYIGVSNFPISLLHELMSKSRIQPAVNQVELHPFLQQPKLLTYCKNRGIHVQAYSPLGTPGFKQEGEPSILENSVLNDLALKYDITVAQVCLFWALQRGTSVVAKSESRDHQKENLQILGDENVDYIKFTDEDMQLIAQIDQSYRYFRPEEWWGSIGMAVFH